MKKILFYLLLIFIWIFPLSSVNAFDDYHFAVLGDRTGGANQEAFEMVLKDIEMLHPDFVITVGDLIEGYSNVATAKEEWNEIFKSFEIISCPIFPVPGNHDIYDDESEELYIEKTGFNPYYTFDFENSHFIILNNAIAENIEQMGKEQIQWLEKDLNKNRTKDNIFVFMHKPFWANGIAEGKEDKLHDIFKGNNVDVVFTGHWHQFASNEYDGIRYILVGSSGANLGWKESIELGNFFQFLWCKVEGDKLYPSIIKAGNIYDIDLVTIEEEQISYDIPTKLIIFDAQWISTQRSIDATVTIINETERTIKSDIAFDYEKNWDIKPELKLIEIEKGDTSVSIFKFIQKGDFYPVPKMEFTYLFGRDKIYEYSQPVRIKKNIVSSRAVTTPVIDGKREKSEWEGASIAKNFADFNGNKTRVNNTEVYFMYDDENLYVNALCYDDEMDKLRTENKNRDDPVYGDDCIGFLLSPDGNNIYHIYISALGTIWDQRVNLEEEKQELSWNGNYEVECSRDKDKWIMELKLPFREIGVSEPGGEIKMNIRRKQQRNGETAVWMLDWAYTPSRYGGLLFK